MCVHIVKIKNNTTNSSTFLSLRVVFSPLLLSLSLSEVPRAEKVKKNGEMKITEMREWITSEKKKNTGFQVVRQHCLRSTVQGNQFFTARGFSICLKKCN